MAPRADARSAGFAPGSRPELLAAIFVTAASGSLWATAASPLPDGPRVQNPMPKTSGKTTRDNTRTSGLPRNRMHDSARALRGDGGGGGSGRDRKTGLRLAISRARLNHSG